MQDILRFLDGLFHNAPFMAALCAILVTQLFKIPIYYWQTKVWDWHKAIEAGGMPSSHGAGVAALTIALAYLVGPHSPIFATAVVFAAIVIYDAGGIRRHAGEHAVLLNRIAMEVAILHGADATAATEAREGERLKEILGHEPPEIIVGAVIGIVIGVLFGKWW